MIQVNLRHPIHEITDLMQFFYQAEKLLQRHGASLSLPVVAVSGSLHTGKSTLINRLLGENISPAGLQGTPCPIFFEYGTFFRAQIWTTDGFEVITRQDELVRLLKDKRYKESLVQLEIAFNHELLKICHLIDTPGTDSAMCSSSLLNILSQAKRIVYLFHQRGIQKCEQEFLLRLKELRNESGHSTFSFWLNCNLGEPDGTSLIETKNFLQEIFGREVPVHTVNTNNQASIQALYLYLKTMAIGELIRQVEFQLRQVDATIPEQVQRLNKFRDDATFLLEFWALKEVAEQALVSLQILHSLPGIQQKIKLMLEDNNRQNLIHVEREVSSRLPDKQKLADLITVPDEDIFLVTAWGPFSSGKSTFFNAVLQENLLPAEDKPTTSCAIYLRYGFEKLAIVHFPWQVTLNLISEQEGRAILRRDELAALEIWLKDPLISNELATLEIFAGSRFRRVNHGQLIEKLNEIKELFSFPHLKRPKKTGNVPLPSLIRPVSLKISNQIVKTVRINLKNPVWQTYHLSQEVEQRRFAQLLASSACLRIKEINLFYPSEFLKLATFVDTPGLDSPHKHHQEVCTSLLDQSDFSLVFLNGKYLLSKTYVDNVLQLINSCLRRQLPERIFFLINFADILSYLEKERVVNHLRRELSGITDFPHIFLISSRAALAGKDASFEKVLNRLGKAISACRERKILSRKA